MDHLRCSKCHRHMVVPAGAPGPTCDELVHGKVCDGLPERYNVRLAQDRSAGARAVYVTCSYAHHFLRDGVASRRFRLADGFSDTNGKPFVDYYCAACAGMLVSPEDLAKAVAEEDERVSRRAY